MIVFQLQRPVAAPGTKLTRRANVNYNAEFLRLNVGTQLLNSCYRRAGGVRIKLWLKVARHAGKAALFVFNVATTRDSAEYRPVYRLAS